MTKFLDATLGLRQLPADHVGIEKLTWLCRPLNSQGYVAGTGMVLLSRLWQGRGVLLDHDQEHLLTRD